MHIFAGLGNPGRTYERTRHNIGFQCIDYLSALYRIPVEKTKFKALLGMGIIQGEKVLLVKPQTFMNNSGESLKAVLDFYKTGSDKLVVIYDDIDLDPGVIRIRTKGSAGTHNGMKSVIFHLQTDEFPRFRIGIGKPVPEQELVPFVLGRYSEAEQKMMHKAIEKIAMAAGEMMVAGIEMIMSKYNGK